MSEVNNCWEWQASKTASGYGITREPVTQRQIGAHRLAWMLSTGDDVYPAVVMHTCDNTSCCNPNHLRAGTQKDNMQDMHRKDRWVYAPRNQSGERNPFAKLSDDDVKQMRELYTRGVTQADLVRKFNATRQNVSLIVRNKSRRV